VLVPDIRDLGDSHGGAVPHASHNFDRAFGIGAFCGIGFQISQQGLLSLWIQFKRLPEMIFELKEDFLP
jgi:hypothetical protein